MPVQPSFDTAGKTLCQRCLDMFSVQGMQELSDSRFRHSPLSTFPERPDCPFCSYVWDVRPAAEKTTLIDTLSELYHKARAGKVRLDPKDGIVCFSTPPATFHDGHWDSLHFGVWREKEGRIWAPLGSLRVAASEGDPFARHTRLRPVRWDSTTEDLAKALRASLSECEQSHGACKHPSPKPLPTRLLRIIPQDRSFPRVQLFLSPEEGCLGRYATLSYCWGGDQEVRLTKESLQRLRTVGLDGGTLPQTLKDAVLTTQWLGLDYLWVDALCIVQDDLEDKAHEIARMCSIYENSLVCIVAATAESVNDGFLKPKHQVNAAQPSCAITVPQEHNDRFHGTMILTPTLQHTNENFAINKRGWTYQEAILSPRTLVFGDLEPFLSCKTRDYGPVIPSHAIWPSNIYPQRISSDARENGIVGKDLVAQFWPLAVREFTGRRLRVVQDRQRAIQGVVDLIARSTRQQCHFGVWTSHMVACLLWCREGHDEAREDQWGRTSTAITGVPTWSWMSVTGFTHYPHYIHAGDLTAGRSLARAWLGHDGCSPPTYNRLHLTCRVMTAAEVRRRDGFLGFWSDIDLPQTDWVKEPEADWDDVYSVSDYNDDYHCWKNQLADTGSLPLLFRLGEIYRMLQDSFRLGEDSASIVVLILWRCPKSDSIFDIETTALGKEENEEKLIGITARRVGDNLYERFGMVTLRPNLVKWWEICKSTVVLK